MAPHSISLTLHVVESAVSFLEELLQALTILGERGGSQETVMRRVSLPSRPNVSMPHCVFL